MSEVHGNEGDLHPVSKSPEGNLFSNIPVKLSEEFVDTIIAHPNVRVERIVSRGHSSPDGFWYDQHEHEWVAVLKGRAKLRMEDGARIALEAGDFLNIPAHHRHRVEWTDPDQETIWLALFYTDEAKTDSTAD